MRSTISGGFTTNDGGKRQVPTKIQPIFKPKLDDSYGARPCENVREPRKRRTVFSIALFEQPSRELFGFQIDQMRRTFYAQIERGVFAQPRAPRAVPAAEAERRLPVQ